MAEAGVRAPADAGGAPTPQPTAGQIMMAVLERLSAQMSQLQSEIEASKGRYAAELRSQVRNQDLIIGLLRDDLGRSAARVDDKFTETL